MPNVLISDDAKRIAQPITEAVNIQNTGSNPVYISSDSAVSANAFDTLLTPGSSARWQKGKEIWAVCDTGLASAIAVSYDTSGSNPGSVSVAGTVAVSGITQPVSLRGGGRALLGQFGLQSTQLYFNNFATLLEAPVYNSVMLNITVHNGWAGRWQMGGMDGAAAFPIAGTIDGNETSLAVSLPVTWDTWNNGYILWTAWSIPDPSPPPAGSYWNAYLYGSNAAVPRPIDAQREKLLDTYGLTAVGTDTLLPASYEGYDLRIAVGSGGSITTAILSAFDGSVYNSAIRYVQRTPYYIPTTPGTLGNNEVVTMRVPGLGKMWKFVTVGSGSYYWSIS